MAIHSYKSTALKKVIVIGSGFSGLSAATALASRGYQVTVLEKNFTPGGRARKFDVDGFTFDMGPSCVAGDLPPGFPRILQGRLVGD